MAYGDWVQAIETKGFTSYGVSYNVTIPVGQPLCRGKGDYWVIGYTNNSEGSFKWQVKISTILNEGDGTFSAIVNTIQLNDPDPDFNSTLDAVTQIADGVICVIWQRDTAHRNYTTIAVSAAGALSIIDSQEELLYVGGGYSGLFHVSGNTWVSMFKGGGSFLLLAVSITSAGVLGGDLGVLAAVASSGWPTMYQVNANTYVVLRHGNSVSTTVYTYTVSDDGATIAAVDSQQIAAGSTASNCPGNLGWVAGNYWACIYNDGSDNGEIATFTIDSAGNIGAPGTPYEFKTGAFYCSPPAAFWSNANMISWISIEQGGPGYRGIGRTITIADDGTIGAIASTLTITNLASSGFIYPYYGQMDTSFYAVCWLDTLSPDVFVITTVEVTTNPGAGGFSLILELAFDQSVLTESPIWTDVTEHLVELDTDRGRDHVFNRIKAGEATFLLENVDGDWWRGNTAGAYYVAAGHEVVKPITLVRLKGVYKSIVYYCYYGYVEGLPHQWAGVGGRGAMVALRAIDLFKGFARMSLPWQTGGGNLYAAELSGTRVGNILDDMGWPAGKRDIDAGQVQLIALAPPTGGTKALDHLHKVSEAEDGVLFIKGNGDVCFQDAIARQTSPLNTSQATFKDDGNDSRYRGVKPVDDETFIYNECSISGPGITEKLVYDSTARALQGPRSLTRTDQLHDLDADALDQAYVAVLRYSDSKLRCQELVVIPNRSPDDLFPKVLGYEISTRITFQLNSVQNPAEIDQEYHIEGIKLHWTKKSGVLECRWPLWETSQFRVFRSTHDGDVYQEDPDYDTAHDAAAADVAENDIGAVTVGQSNEGSGISDDFYVYRGVVQFGGTTALDPSDTIGRAIIGVYLSTPWINTTQFVLTVVPATDVAIPLVVTDYGDLLNDTTVYGTVTIPVGTTGPGWLFFELTAAGIAAVQKGSATLFGFRSNRDISKTTPGAGPASELVGFDGVGTDNPPRLIVRLD